MPVNGTSGAEGSPLLAHIRLGIGIACVLVTVAAFAVKVPAAIREFNSAVRGDAYIKDQLGRVLTSGDSLGLPYGLQAEALQLIPPDSDYAVLLPATPEAAAPYGMNSLTYVLVEPFLRYLLLPARPAPPEDAHYVICWGCDTSPWDHRTTWLWKNDQGQAIGRVRR